MKRKFKRIASLVLAAVMVFAMAVPAMATETYKNQTGPFSLKITSPEGHIYQAYQIFGGKIAREGTIEPPQYILSDIVWGKNVNHKDADFLTGVQGLLDLTETQAKDAALVAKALEEQSEDAQKFADLVAEHLTGDPAVGDDDDYSDGNYTINNLDAGYYLVKDADNTQESGAYTLFMLEVVGNVSARAKSDVPTAEKKVKETNDSIPETSDWQYAADYDIGDKVPFQLTGTVAANYDAYDTYYFAFHDTEDTGLTFDPTSVKVYVDYDGDGEGERIDITGKTDFWNLEQNATHGEAPNPVITHTFDIVFANLKSDTLIKAGSKIIVEYNSTLNENAKIGQLGNENKMYLEYSNNPNNGQHGNTPEHKVTVFTFKLDVNKVRNPEEGEEGKQPLEGAGFTLWKWNGEDWAKVNVKKAGEDIWKVVTEGTEGAVTEIKGEGLTNFNWQGLDEGKYKLEETTVPDGYNKAPDITFDIVASYEPEEEAEGSSLDKLEVQNVDPEDMAESFTCNIGGGSVSVDILNQEGSTLPETGGIGTTIFYVVGSVLVLGAVILLVTKRRMKG